MGRKLPVIDVRSRLKASIRVTAPTSEHGRLGSRSGHNHPVPYQF